MTEEKQGTPTETPPNPATQAMLRLAYKAKLFALVGATSQYAAAIKAVGEAARLAGDGPDANEEEAAQRAILGFLSDAVQACPGMADVFVLASGKGSGPMLPG